MKQDGKSPLGCAIGIVAIFIMLPLWGAMTFAVLVASGAPAWAWVIFCFYMPMSFFFQIVAKIADALDD